MPLFRSYSTSVNACLGYYGRGIFDAGSNPAGMDGGSFAMQRPALAMQRPALAMQRLALSITPK